MSSLGARSSPGWRPFTSLRRSWGSSWPFCIPAPPRCGLLPALPSRRSCFWDTGGLPPALRAAASYFLLPTSYIILLDSHFSLYVHPAPIKLVSASSRQRHVEWPAREEF